MNEPSSPEGATPADSAAAPAPTPADDGGATRPAPLLEVRDLRTWFFTSAGVVKAVDGVDLTVGRGEIVGLVGESGSGKSVTSLSVMRLVDEPGRIVDGSIRFDGQELLSATNAEMRALRGSRIGMIFQQPISSLNPSYRVGFQIAEVYEIHEDLKRSVGWERAEEMLARVGIADPKQRARAYPHEMSGGQAQRVMIAMALAGHPQLLIADEPTTALDVTIQAQILDLMLDLQAELGMSVVLITHNLGIVAEVCERVAVMYAGQIVEEADTRTLFRDPKHPYTSGLIGSVPVIGQRRHRLEVIPGRVPNLIGLPVGCRFAPRCKAREEHGLTQCTEALPALVEVEPGHRVRCYLHSDAVEEPTEVSVAVGRR
jgi:oligopeptide/dipeptide ABC transporter ATP-binding protein